MVRQQQKDRERYGLETFRRLCPDLPDGDPQPGETPDFTVETAGGVVGIEVVEYMKDAGSAGSAGMAAATRRRKVAREAERIYTDELKGPPVAVSIQWTDDRPRKRDEARLASGLAALVALAPPRTGQRAWAKSELPNAVRTYVRGVLAVAMETASGFISPEADWMGPDIAGVQRVLSSKDGAAAQCRERADSVWLLAVGYGDGLVAQIMSLDKVIAADYESAFDRVYLVDIFSQGWARLRARLP